ncbi:MAG TPA: hypothetical protein VJ781_05945, partial [Pyrinomonadaceae bacterium]|nr:hypothetical protein [Pyrinomonadaceae bacterium]
MAKQALLIADLGCQWFVDLTIAVVIAIVPKSVAAMAIIRPTGVIDDRIQAYSVDVGTTPIGD